VTGIVANVTLPVTLDLEAGYGDTAEAVGETAARVTAVGAIGFNLEDQIIGGEGLYSIGDQCLRIEAARKAANRAQVPMFINARTDIFLNANAEQHDDRLGNEALHRALAYAEAGASGFFVPGLVDERLIGRLCTACPLPVNIMMKPTAPSAKRLAELSVARISHGPGPYRQMMKFLDEAARAVYAR
jgi:2-methylisocitrate lyase-like PEP mutase family enzyme